jgi:hypothetical protein
VFLGADTRAQHLWWDLEGEREATCLYGEITVLATCRLWLGRSPETLKCLTHARGDGTWGLLGDASVLADGDPAALEALFRTLELERGKPRQGEPGRGLPPLRVRALPPTLIGELRHRADVKAVVP